MPSAKQLGAFYSQGHHAHAMDDSCNTAERMRVLSTIQGSVGPGKNLLDVGCGFGFYLDAAALIGFNACGFEIDSGRASACAARGHQVWSGETLDCVPSNFKWDVIILNHVIEHLLAPDELLGQLHSRMHKDSVLYVACPNFQSLRAKIQGIHYSHVCPPEHIQYFSAKSLVLTLKTAGFSSIKIDYSTHELHVKDLFAHVIKGRWLRTFHYTPPVPDEDYSPQRFVDGGFPAFRRLTYGGLLAVSRRFVPVVNWVGGDHFETYWRLDGQ
jgi:2-polyprenyl-3-methyl-5-hydroxy-6-metoxy-1,4-benzoquinol methylase